MNRYQKLCKKLIPFKKGCFIPFVVLGDPSIDMSLKIINALIENGADGLELGIPFSDPIADGEIIQKANLRAFNSKINLHKCFDILSEIREKHQTIPIGLLLYSNLIFKFGINKFYLKCYKIGIDSILIADLPIEESYVFRKYAIINNILPVFICPPDAKKNVIKNIAIHSQGYIYLLSRSGVTGINQEIMIPPLSLINKLKKLTKTPLIQGFGVSYPYQIQKIILSGISGVICGSIIAKLIENYFQDDDKLIKEIIFLSKSFKKATIIIE
ncbi:tryptophan synthase subunit alpha [Buchnera aphidicola]|uniref:Tryptophan synthase alpha chain n=1 Tax=Buchnera aphidicola subsp. Melaphis rhois TaxID=118103 RepID=A0A4D6YC60_BUCMH|nr:tryptophan synthase subunit alpha [Buchnera aphidicola]QCI23564.1 tryptophan synthase subunit alpha [Buchnera aphidicola (Melaphis rhois)]